MMAIWLIVFTLASCGVGPATTKRASLPVLSKISELRSPVRKLRKNAQFLIETIDNTLSELKRTPELAEITEGLETSKKMMIRANLALEAFEQSIKTLDEEILNASLEEFSMSLKKIEEIPDYIQRLESMQSLTAKQILYINQILANQSLIYR